MNERIAKLANESGFDVDKSGVFGNYSEMHRIEKLAELIVRECAKRSEELGQPELGKGLMKHFGVEDK
jgi:hypothetical protein